MITSLRPGRTPRTPCLLLPAPPVASPAVGWQAAAELRRPRRPVAGAVDELVEGSVMVAELGEGPGLLLWRAAKDVRAWAAGPEPLRPFLFPPAAGPDRRRLLKASGVDERLWAPLCVIVCLVQEREPADPARVLHACRRIAHWAADHGAPATRTVFDACAAVILRDYAS